MKSDKLQVVIALFIVFAIAATGCGPATPVETQTQLPESNTPTSSAVEEVTLNILGNWGPTDSKGPTLQKIFDDFMAANPNITIVYDVKTDKDIPTAVETAFMAGLEPDIVLNEPAITTTTTWVPQGVIIPLNDFITEWGFEGKFVSAGIKNWTYDGNLLGFPLEGSVWPFWYNTKIFSELNLPIPTTWAEIIADAPAIKAAGYEVVAAGANSRYTFGGFLPSSMTTEELAPMLAEGHWADHPNAVTAVEQFVAARDAGVFPASAAGLQEADANNLFYTGQAAIWPGGSWYFGECPAEMYPNVQLGGIPLTTPTVLPRQQINAGYFAKGVMITRNGATKLDAVKKFIQFLYTPENMGKFVEAAGMISPLLVTTVDQSKLNPIILQSAKLSEKYDLVSWPDYVPGTNTPAGVDYSQALNDAWLPTMTVEMIIQEMDQAYLDGLGH
jgi:multiple sugar transport system substrate-binding protein